MGQDTRGNTKNQINNDTIKLTIVSIKIEIHTKIDG